MPLAERRLDIVRHDGLTVIPDQRVGRVELDDILSTVVPGGPASATRSYA